VYGSLLGLGRLPNLYKNELKGGEKSFNNESKFIILDPFVSFYKYYVKAKVYRQESK